jgi:hypothetical protein
MFGGDTAFHDPYAKRIFHRVLHRLESPEMDAARFAASVGKILRTTGSSCVFVFCLPKNAIHHIPLEKSAG